MERDSAAFIAPQTPGGLQLHFLACQDPAKEFPTPRENKEHAGIAVRAAFGAARSYNWAGSPAPRLPLGGDGGGASQEAAPCAYPEGGAGLLGGAPRSAQLRKLETRLACLASRLLPGLLK